MQKTISKRYIAECKKDMEDHEYQTGDEHIRWQRRRSTA